MAKLFLQRHLKSQWNLESRFAGWVDVPLAKEKKGEAAGLAKNIFKSRIDVVYTSSLARNRDTVEKILKYHKKYPIFIHLNKGRMKKWGGFTEINKDYMPVYVSDELNERCYGKLQGLNKAATIKKYGEKQVHLWRRGFNSPPPGGESLKKVIARVVPFFRKYIAKDINSKKNILVVGSHNSLRAIMKHIEKISNDEIANVEIPYGGLLEYELSSKSKLKKKKIHK